MNFTNYTFTGKHAIRVDQLTSIFDEKSKSILIESITDIYTIAPLIGFLYERRAEIDQENDSETTRNFHSTRDLKDLAFNYRLIMLLDSEYESDPQLRIRKAFKDSETDSADRDRFNSYVRGGVDVLYEKLIEGKSDPDSYIERLHEFLKAVNDRFNSKIDSEEILKLCREISE